MAQPPKLEILESVSIDDAVLDKLPPGTVITGTVGHGSSFWTQTVRVNARSPDSQAQSYFLKIAKGAEGHGMMRGEYLSTSEFYKFLPSLSPRPLGWGTYKSDPETHFYVCDFHDLTEDELPDYVLFCERLAQVHTHSMSGSPGKFGFEVPTYVGRLPQYNSWCESWETYFTKAMQAMLVLEKEVQGPSEKLDNLLEAMYTKVIPRLLRPLESHGRKVKPCLIHGDIWWGNTGTDIETDEPKIFDACAFWGHNEYDIGQWKIVRTRFTKTYMKEYHKHVPISAPEEDWEDRCLLYSLRYNIHSAALYPGRSDRHRKNFMDDMEALVTKYPNGYEGQ